MVALRCLLMTVLLYPLASSSQPEVVIQQGRVRGLYSRSVSGRRYSSFFGIPYAKPPVGKHRFKEPVASDPWLGVYNATKYPPECLQFNHLLMNTPQAVTGSEDCLYINVYTPLIPKGVLDTEGVPEKKLLDVIAFIHGGAFMFLASTKFGGSILLDRDVVLVTFNYRLGPLGFLSTGDAAAPGNNGLKDQVLALQWIRKNIAAFGGDPGSVTIAGLSAGGASVHYHVLSPLSKGLFKAAICVSGTSLNPWSLAENSREKAIHLARTLGCPVEDSLSMIKCLRNRPAEHIVATSRNFMPWLYNPFSPYALVIEPPSPSAFLPDTPINIIKQGKASDIPILFTFTKEEGLYPGAEIVVKPENLKELQNRWNELLPFVLDYNSTAPSERSKEEASQKIKDYYNVDLNTNEGAHNLIKLLGDRLFVDGIAKSAKLHASLYTSPVYLFRFSYSGQHTTAVVFGGTKDLGVSHGDDILYVLTLSGLGNLEDESDRQMSRDMVNLWVSFVSNGTLEGRTVSQDLPKIGFMDIRGPGQLVQTTVDELAEGTFWDSLGFLENTAPVSSHEEL